MEKKKLSMMALLYLVIHAVHQTVIWVVYENEMKGVLQMNKYEQFGPTHARIPCYIEIVQFMAMT